MSTKVEMVGKSGKRSYEGDYAMLFVASKNAAGGVNSRWVQDPANWEGGMGMFLAGIEMLRGVAEDFGDEPFKVAARSALEAVNKLDPSRQNVKEG